MLKKITQKLLKRTTREYHRDKTRDYLKLKRKVYRPDDGMAFNSRTSHIYHSNSSKL